MFQIVFEDLAVGVAHLEADATDAIALGFPQVVQSVSVRIHRVADELQEFHRMHPFIGDVHAGLAVLAVRSRRNALGQVLRLQPTSTDI